MRTFFMESDRLRFGRWMNEDAALAKSLWGDPNVTKYICASGRFSDADVEKRLQSEMDSQNKFDVQYWPVFRKTTSDFVGCCGCTLSRTQSAHMSWGFK